MQDASSEPLHLALRRARHAANMRQGELALKVGCTQSALSMFEGGKAGVLASGTVKKLAEVLGVALPAGFGEETRLASTGAAGALARHACAPGAFCPNFQCLSNLPYTVGGQVFFLPLGTAGCGAHCAMCGEIVERTCPSCGAAIAGPGGCCAACGAPLVSWPEGFSGDPEGWISAQREAIAQVRSFVRGSANAIFSPTP